ncbi:MraY family glycosyltransferase [Sphingobacterium daejeonense]|uniref:MraY family glycosyltransferase n=1 Tax=Sphingobacterium daejeonense TaxID=371142 RepID=UPI0010C53CC2|nr:glycosyltransferase family 4 protein [Sphingobacterium daejeonense]VTQ07305.1 Undecaprenyl-phosphate alpha-N-acetylglucosaminyl 1-phosphate transferase [Sphingobacterium daejeonense]
MEYFVILVGLIVLELLYFKVADKYNIIDKPNLRSSHTEVTIRGGGVIFYFGALAYFFYSGFNYPWFFLGLTLMTVISFLDDILTLSNKIRLLFHFGSVLLMVYQLEVFDLPWYYLIITFIIVVGVINAYNFMDGINGITAIYSLTVIILLIIVNNYEKFIDQDLLIFSMISILVFGYFNFRKVAKTFAGDVGSVSIAFIILFCLGALIIKTGNLIYILFLALYGIDTIWTIIRRLSLNENIFEAHRSHLYQYLSNEAGVNKLFVSFTYGIIQFVIGVLVILVSGLSSTIQITFSIILLLFLSGIYLWIKDYIIKVYVLKNIQK